MGPPSNGPPKSVKSPGPLPRCIHRPSVFVLHLVELSPILIPPNTHLFLRIHPSVEYLVRSSGRVRIETPRTPMNSTSPDRKDSAN